MKANKRAKVEPEYLKVVREYLEKVGAWEKAKKAIMKLNIVERVMINLLPFAIDMSILEEYIDEKVRRRVEQELYEVRKRMVTAVEQQLKKRLRNIIENLEKYAKQQFIINPMHRRQLKKALRETEKIAIEFGIELPELKIVKEMLELPPAELGRKLLKEKTSGRLKALVEELGR